MPAATMISSNTRASRSRFSSPQQPPNGTPEAAAKPAAGEGQKAFMQRWLEPPVQVKASYQDAGLMRHGVVEGMAPLGTMPKVGIFKKAAPPPEHAPIRKIILKRPAQTRTPLPTVRKTPGEEDETEEEDEQSSDEDQAALLPPSSAARRQSVTAREADGEWSPTKTTPGQQNLASRSFSRASAGRMGSLTSAASLQQTPTHNASRFFDSKDAVDQAVEAAVDEALKHFRYPTAWALRTLYDENSENEQFSSMIEGICLQTADPETVEEFARLMHEKKKEGKKDNKGCYYFVPPSTNSRFTPHKPKRAPYAHLVRLDVPSFNINREEPQVPEPDAEQGEDHLRKRRKADRPHGSSSKKPSNGLKVRANMDSPSLRRRNRASSESSSSSLSSARSMSPPVGAVAEDVFDVPPSRTSPAADSTNKAPIAPQPIASRRRSTAAQTHKDVSPTHTPSSLTTISHSQHESSASAGAFTMPAAIEEPLFPNLTSKKAQRKAVAPDDDEYSFPSAVGRLDQSDKTLRLRAKARNVTNGTGTPSDSFSRNIPRLDVERPDPPQPRTAPKVLLSTSAAVSDSPNVRSTRASLKRTHDEIDDQVSPTTLNFPMSEVPSAADSRAGTPGARSAKRARTGLRIKTSPKKKGGTSAGIPRAGGERTSPVPNGTAVKEDDNDDYCSSCGGSGELVCCDGCVRSFHLTCFDPAISEDRMPNEWYCNVCLSKRDPASLPAHSGTFAQMLGKLDVKNSIAFRLPVDIKEYFEGVQTGAEGEYEDAASVVKPTRKKKNEEEQIPDFFRVRDNNGGPIICHSCNKATEDNRAIIPCSMCGLWWHIDCLDPPLANPPVLRTWKCPAHIDDLLAKIPGALGPAHKFRKIRGAPAIKVAFTRGTVNNGYIDVEPEESDDESGWKDVDTFGRTYRLPEKGIKLDFFTRVRENRKGKRIAPLADSTPVNIAQTPVSFDGRSLEEQQAALNLTQFSGQDASGILTLIDTLLDNAPPVVISMIARGDSAHLKHNVLGQADAQSLRAMLAQMDEMSARIKALLNPGPSVPARAAPTPEDASSSPLVPSSAALSPPNTSKLQEAEVDPDRTASTIYAADTEIKKNLPSPAATDVVTNGVLLEDKPKLANRTVVSAKEALLPITPNGKPVAEHREVALEPTSDDMLMIDDSMEVD